MIGLVACCLATKSSLFLLKSNCFKLCCLSAEDEVFLLCGIGKGLTEGNGFTLFAFPFLFAFGLSFGFRLFFVRVFILSDKSLTAVDRVVKSSNVLSNGA